jgi:D-glycero-D-manno-heptose 1,7-bisphosphate phosphatase
VRLANFYLAGLQRDGLFFENVQGVRRGKCYVGIMKTAIFIERDGILNLTPVERGYQVVPSTLEQFQINELAVGPLEQLKAAGFVLVGTTNQPGLSQGTVQRRELDRMHELLRQRFPLDDLLVCPHDETDECPCRKPRAGLLTEAAFKWQLDLERSFVISDKWQDSNAARTAGCTSMLIQSPWIGRGHHDFVLSSLDTIVDKILRLQANHMAA